MYRIYPIISYGKSSFFIGKPTISIPMFHPPNVMNSPLGVPPNLAKMLLMPLAQPACGADKKNSETSPKVVV